MVHVVSRPNHIPMASILRDSIGDGDRRNRGGRFPPEVRSPGKFYGPGLAEDGDLDLAGIDQLFLDRAGDVAAELGGFVVVELVAVGDDADLAAGLDRVCLLDAGEAAGQGLELFEP